jgi:hypothetical protein
VAGGNRVDLVHVGALAVQAHRHDGAGARRDRGLDTRGVDVAGVGLDVHPDRHAAQQDDGLRRGRERERRGDDLVARLQVQRHHRDQQRLGAAGHGDAMFRAGMRHERGLELLHLGAHDVLAVIQHLLHAHGDLVAQRGVLGLEVDEFDLGLRRQGGVHALLSQIIDSTAPSSR